MELKRFLLSQMTGTNSFIHIPHCKENPIYVLSEKKLRGLSPKFHIHVSVSDLYILTIGPHVFLQQNRQTDSENL